MRAPLLVSGYPRSGTTLLRALLGAHSRIELVNEPELILGMMTAGLRPGVGIDAGDRTGLLRNLEGIGVCSKHLASLPPYVLNQFRDHPEELSFQQAFEMLLPKPAGDVVWGWKSLNDVFYLPAMGQLYPNMLFVNIVRDPHAAILSLYRKTHGVGAPETPSFTADDVRFVMFEALRWREWVRSASEGGQSLAQDCYLELRFEELVSDPQTKTTTICSALGLEYEADILDPANRQNDPALSSDAAFAHVRLRDAVDISRASAGSGMPPWCSFIITRYAGETMATWGYSNVAPDLGVLERARVTAACRMWEAGVQNKVQRFLRSRSCILPTGERAACRRPARSPAADRTQGRGPAAERVATL